jgi:NitT/TauT family transport system permease protein
MKLESRRAIVRTPAYVAPFTLRRALFSLESPRVKLLPAKFWGEATAFLRVRRAFGWADLLVLIGAGAILAGLFGFAGEWREPLRPAVEIDLSPSALPKYALFSLARGVLAYFLSLAFTFAYGYWAAKDKKAERVLVPLLDILQSIPVLVFMPGLVIALVRLFPTSNVGLELAAVLMIFTGQVWNLTFSFYHSLKSVPDDLRDVSRIYRFSWRERARLVELPYATMGLVWNSMMSMAGGWFFLMINEAFELGHKDYRLPGIGAYMSVAVSRGDTRAIVSAIVVMGSMIVAIDQLVWRPAVVWAEKFRADETSSRPASKSNVLLWLRRSRILAALGEKLGFERRSRKVRARPQEVPLAKHATPKNASAAWLTRALAVAGVGVLLYGGAQLGRLVTQVSFAAWLDILRASLFTFARVFAAIAIGTVWTVPAGLAIGLSPRLSRALQPVVQVMASFPAPMLFPLVVGAFAALGVGLGWSSIALMLLGTQWYILFNVVAGALAMPADLREAARMYGIRGWARFKTLYFPAIFPYLVTGWVTAAGGAWNASIVAEYFRLNDKTLRTEGLGSMISEAADGGKFGLLIAAGLAMAGFVVLFNRVVWQRCYRLAEARYSLNR